MSKLLHKAVRQKSETAFSVYQQHLANRPVNVSSAINLSQIVKSYQKRFVKVDHILNLTSGSS